MSARTFGGQARPELVQIRGADPGVFTHPTKGGIYVADAVWDRWEGDREKRNEAARRQRDDQNRRRNLKLVREQQIEEAREDRITDLEGAVEVLQARAERLEWALEVHRDMARASDALILELCEQIDATAVDRLAVAA